MELSPDDFLSTQSLEAIGSELQEFIDDSLAYVPIENLHIKDEPNKSSAVVEPHNRPGKATSDSSPSKSDDEDYAEFVAGIDKKNVSIDNLTEHERPRSTKKRTIPRNRSQNRQKRSTSGKGRRSNSRSKSRGRRSKSRSKSECII